MPISLDTLDLTGTGKCGYIERALVFGEPNRHGNARYISLA